MLTEMWGKRKLIDCWWVYKLGAVTIEISMEVPPKIKLLINLTKEQKEKNTCSSPKPELSVQYSHLAPYGTLQFQFQEDPKLLSF